MVRECSVGILEGTSLADAAGWETAGEQPDAPELAQRAL